MTAWACGATVAPGNYDGDDSAAARAARRAQHQTDALGALAAGQIEV